MKKLFLLCSAIVLMAACKKTNKQDGPIPATAEKVCRISMITGLGKYEYDSKGNVVKAYSVDSLDNTSDDHYEENIFNDKNELIIHNAIENKVNYSSFLLHYYDNGLLKSIVEFKGLNGSGKEISKYDFFYDNTILNYIIQFENAVKYDSTAYGNPENNIPTTYKNYTFSNGEYSLHREYKRTLDAVGNELKLEYFEKSISSWVRVVERTFEYGLEDFTLNLVPLYKVWNKPKRAYWINPIKTLKYYSFDNGKESIDGDNTIEYVKNGKNQIEQMIFNSDSPERGKAKTKYSLFYECK